MKRFPSVQSGQLLFATGVLHSAVGLVVYRAEVADILRRGLLGAVPDDHTPGAAALWFLTAGLMMMVLGSLYRWIEGHLRQTLPFAAGVWLLGVAGFVVVLMPQSGAWLIAVQAVLIMVRARAQSRRQQAAGAAA